MHDPWLHRSPVSFWHPPQLEINPGQQEVMQGLVLQLELGTLLLKHSLHFHSLWLP
jgi:hypothetical protein